MDQKSVKSNAGPSLVASRFVLEVVLDDLFLIPFRLRQDQGQKENTAPTKYM
ncbi:MAG TPA: hypothetical protein VFV38_18040 [Ktedonobacteraceae bacterium]|nr:hypothetical protein [Ktedonobacteraceae bacterium]